MHYQTYFMVDLMKLADVLNMVNFYKLDQNFREVSASP
jgi:hypothetical protein